MTQQILVWCEELTALVDSEKWPAPQVERDAWGGWWLTSTRTERDGSWTWHYSLGQSHAEAREAIKKYAPFKSLAPPLLSTAGGWTFKRYWELNAVATHFCEAQEEAAQAIECGVPEEEFERRMGRAEMWAEAYAGVVAFLHEGHLELVACHRPQVAAHGAKC